MIAGIGSSLSTALRSAGVARERFDRATEQIATGKRVSSVRDDGAAWTRAAVSRADATGNRAIADQITWLSAGVGIHRASVEARLSLGQQSEQNALRAMDPGMSAQTRAELDVAQIQLSAQISDMSPTNHDSSISLVATSGAVWQPSGTNIADTNLSWITDTTGAVQTTNWSAVTFQPAIAMNSVASVAAATTTRANRAVRNAEWAQLAVNLGALQGRMDRQADSLVDRADRLDAVSASLTDADLASASKTQAQAEVRQQLAMSTVRQALNIYGAYASGLLGNVRQTQRALA